ncbi:hypothetical protein ACFSKM_19435 [Ancylobacter dichloromethanicus]
MTPAAPGASAPSRASRSAPRGTLRQRPGSPAGMTTTAFFGQMSRQGTSMTATWAPLRRGFFIGLPPSCRAMAARSALGKG